MQTPIRNYILFFIVSFLIVAGWQSLRDRIDPPKPRVWAYPARPRAEQIDLVSRMATPGPLGALDAAATYVRGPVRPRVPPVVWPYQGYPDQQQILALSQLAAGGAAGDPTALAAALRFDRKSLEFFAQEAAPVPETTLGGDGFALTATLTPRGAGVRELILNHFPAADTYGRPVRDAAGKPEPLVLVPKSSGPPAYAMFHYAKADESDPRPLDTLGRRVWQSQRRDTPTHHAVEFSTELPEFGLRVIKTFTLAKAEYHLGLSVSLERTAASDKEFRYQIVGAKQLPIEGEWYTSVYRNVMVAWEDNAGYDHRIAYDSTTLSNQSGSDRSTRGDKRFTYAAVTTQYFAAAIAPDDQTADGSKLAGDQRKFLQFTRATIERDGGKPPRKPFLEDVTARAISESVKPANEPVNHRYVLYHGPLKVRQLARLSGPEAVAPGLVERYADSLRLRTFTDYGNYGAWTDAIIFFTNICHKVLGGLYYAVPNYAICILLLTVFVRLMIAPMSLWQTNSAKKLQAQMAKLQPEINKLKKLYKDDILQLQQEQSKLFKKHGVNPAGQLGGCLLIFLQMPVFMGLYYALQESVFLRLEPFLWIQNLAAPDMMLWWGEWIPYVTSPDALGTMFYIGPYLNLLPVISVGLILVQQKLTMPPPADEEQAQMQAMMQYFFLPLMGFIFFKMAAGMTIYFIASSAWGLAERKVLDRFTSGAVDDKPNLGKAKPAKPKSPPGKLATWWQNILDEASKK